MCIHKILRIVYINGFVSVIIPSSPTPCIPLLGILADPLVFAICPSLDGAFLLIAPKPEDEVGILKLSGSSDP